MAVTPPGLLPGHGGDDGSDGEHLLCARHSAKYFPYMLSTSKSNNLILHRRGATLEEIRTQRDKQICPSPHCHVGVEPGSELRYCL